MILNKKKINFNIIKKIIREKGFELKKKKNFFNFKELKSFYYTVLSGFILILSFFLLPLSVNIKKDINLNKQTVDNNSSINFQKVLDGKSLQEDTIDKDLDIKSLFEDVFSLNEDVQTDTVRLKASTVKELFKDTDYSLQNIRKTKLVKPVKLSLLPEEMKNIQSTKEKKKLFLEIVLPLVLEENNRIKIDRKKLFSILNKNNNSKKETIWLNKKFKQYGVVKKDLATLKIRMDEVPVSLALAQAAKETGWGTSRFAIEGNALFGQWTWSKKGISPKNKDKNKSHKVLQFQVLKASVRAYKNNLNTHNAYKEFREARAKIRENSDVINGLELTKYLKAYASIGEKYVAILDDIIERNSLTDFDKSNLLPTKSTTGVAL
mgnify:CR=1 FL=1